MAKKVLHFSYRYKRNNQTSASSLPEWKTNESELFSPLSPHLFLSKIERPYSFPLALFKGRRKQTRVQLKDFFSTPASRKHHEKERERIIVDRRCFTRCMDYWGMGRRRVFLEEKNMVGEGEGKLWETVPPCGF